MYKYHIKVGTVLKLTQTKMATCDITCDLDYGYQFWKEDGVYHRDNDPSMVYRSGFTCYFQRGVLHRDGGPALIDPARGLEEWYQHGKLHRDNGPARTGSWVLEEYYQNGELHREGGPARILANGFRVWYRHGKMHRMNGPAIDGPVCEYWIDGVQQTD